MLEEKEKVVVERAQIQTVSYSIKIPKPYSDYYLVLIDVMQSEDGFVHAIKIGGMQLDNVELRALFALFKQERLYVERDD